MATFETRGFHHVSMVSGDAPRTLAFYRDTLGLGLIKQTVNYDDPAAYHLYFGDHTGSPGTLLTFFEWKGLPQGRPGIGGVHHVALGVADKAALLKWKRWLTDRGVPVTGPKNRGYFASLYFTDPDGQILEIATKGPGYTIDEPAESLGSTVVQPAPSQLEGSPEADAFERRTHPEPVTSLTPDMALDGIHHISSIGTRLDRLHAFYQEALGLVRIKQTVNQDDLRTAHHFWAHLEHGMVTPRSSMTVFGWPPNYKYTAGGVGQTHHVAFRARDAEEQAAWREHLIANGVAVSPVMERNYFKSIYFRDPDGLLLEIATDGPGCDSDEALDQLGKRLALPAWLEGEREQIERELVPLT